MLWAHDLEFQAANLLAYILTAQCKTPAYNSQSTPDLYFSRGPGLFVCLCAVLQEALHAERSSRAQQQLSSKPTTTTITTSRSSSLGSRKSSWGVANDSGKRSSRAGGGGTAADSDALRRLLLLHHVHTRSLHAEAIVTGQDAESRVLQSSDASGVTSGSRSQHHAHRFISSAGQQVRTLLRDLPVAADAGADSKPGAGPSSHKQGGADAAVSNGARSYTNTAPAAQSAGKGPARPSMYLYSGHDSSISPLLAGGIGADAAMVWEQLVLHVSGACTRCMIILLGAHAQHE